MSRARQGRGKPKPHSNRRGDLSSRQFGVVVAGFCSFLQMYSTQPLLPMLTGIFHASKFAVSMTVTLAGLGVAIAAHRGNSGGQDRPQARDRVVGIPAGRLQPGRGDFTRTRHAVVLAILPGTLHARCLLGHGVCGETPSCVVHKRWAPIATSMNGFFADTTLADLFVNRPLT